jgi:glyoxylase-like metal-dependent hydrolase (beta-lactamase superfamily II)
VLVDAFITVGQARALGEWVEVHGKRLTTIYATHGHGDHFFGASTVLQRFPRARLVATPDVVKTMRQQASPPFLSHHFLKGVGQYLWLHSLSLQHQCEVWTL